LPDRYKKEKSWFQSGKKHGVVLQCLTQKKRHYQDFEMWQHSGLKHPISVSKLYTFFAYMVLAEMI